MDGLLGTIIGSLFQTMRKMALLCSDSHGYLSHRGRHEASRPQAILLPVDLKGVSPIRVYLYMLVIYLFAFSMSLAKRPHIRDVISLSTVDLAN